MLSHYWASLACMTNIFLLILISTCLCWSELLSNDSTNCFNKALKCHVTLKQYCTTRLKLYACSTFIIQTFYTIWNWSEKIKQKCTVGNIKNTNVYDTKWERKYFTCVGGLHTPVKINGINNKAAWSTFLLW